MNNKIMSKQSPKKQVWVSPKQGGGWRVHQTDTKRDSVHVDNKADAVKRAVDIAKRNAAELRVQNKDGKISQANTYGRDPFPPKG
jgi:frataxin-like iron-binding protein CyaY